MEKGGTRTYSSSREVSTSLKLNLPSTNEKSTLFCKLFATSYDIIVVNIDKDKDDGNSKSSYVCLYIDVVC